MLITYKVSELVNNIKITLEENFPLFEVVGELSEINYHSKTGNIYFKICDEKSYVSCVLWKSQAFRYQQFLQLGKEVKIKGRITSYVKTASIQIVVVSISFSKDGDIKKYLEELTAKLTSEGLFNLEHKQKITRFPKEIGIITSKDGAVLGDIRKTLANRYPCKIKLYDVFVQGEESINNVIEGIKWFNNNSSVDFIIIARGGGGLEDLYHFNDETLVRTIFDSKIPIISAVGHENNSCLADKVADLSVVTPTASVTHLPLKEDLMQNLNSSLKIANRILGITINNYSKTLQVLQDSIISPVYKIQIIKDNLDSAIQIIKGKSLSAVVLNINSLQHLNNDIKNTLQRQILQIEKNLKNIQANIAINIKNYLDINKSNIINIGNTIERLSVNSTLKRGFALVSQNGKVIKSSKDIKKGPMTIEFIDGKIKADL